MADVGEEIFQAMLDNALLKGVNPPAGRLRHMAQLLAEQIARTDPASIEPETEVIHPRHTRELVLVSYEGDTVTVRGFPDNDESNGSVEFKLPSDEIAVAEYIRGPREDGPVVIVLIAGGDVPDVGDGNVH